MKVGQGDQISRVGMRIYQILRVMTYQRVGDSHYNNLARLLLKLDLARMDTETKCQGLLEKKAQRSLTKVWSRSKSLSVGRVLESKA